MLDEAAEKRQVPGASALAREILERWASETHASQTRATIDRATNYLRAHPAGWGDEPADFFPQAKSRGRKR